MTHLRIANHDFSSRLILGSGKFSSPQLMKEAIIASETNMVTITVRRVDLANPNDSFIEIIQSTNCIFLPNTSGARNAEEALRCARLARAGSGSDWIKLEVTPEPNYLLPDAKETLIAAEKLVKEGFKVMPYIQADPILAKQLEDCGCVSVMPLASPIGSNRGLDTRLFIEMIIEQARIPVIIDAGLGAPSHAALAMELGADAVLVNTAIATATDPIMMAKAFQQAVIAGRLAYEAGLAPTTSMKANASSPLTGFIH